jgi:hypothetical protein
MIGGRCILLRLWQTLLVSSGLHIITRKLDSQVLISMMIAGLVTIPVSQLLADLAGEPNWHLILFPIGQAFLNGLAGYWLMRAKLR